MTKKLYLALLCGGGGGSLSCFLFHFFIASSFPNPLPLSVRVVCPAGGGEQGWRCGVCVVCVQSASATCITLLGGTCLCSGIVVDVSVCLRVCVNH